MHRPRPRRGQEGLRADCDVDAAADYRRFEPRNPSQSSKSLTYCAPCMYARRSQPWHNLRVDHALFTSRQSVRRKGPEKRAFSRLELAEREGFEPPCRLLGKTLSRRPRYDHFGTSPFIDARSRRFAALGNHLFYYES